MKHTILGAGGSIGNSLTAELLKKNINEQIRQVSRSNYSISGTESYKADITSYDETLAAIKGSNVVYLLVGLQYNAKIWAELWPKIMQNTIDACKATGAKLIFFDNVYMYGKVSGKMTESTPYNPCSKKGEIRAAIARKLEDEIKQKNIDAIIARAADFYGPYAIKTSVPYLLVIDKLMNDKKAQWLIDVNKSHTYSFTTDCAEGLIKLANTENAFNQIWHLPTFNPGITGKEFIEKAAAVLGKVPNYSVFSKFMLKLGGLFDKTIAELVEMTYQNEYDYYFDSTKFNTSFNFTPASYDEGIRKTIEFIQRK